MKLSEMKRLTTLLMVGMTIMFPIKAENNYQPILEAGKMWIIEGLTINEQTWDLEPFVDRIAYVTEFTEEEGERKCILRQENQESDETWDIPLKEKDKCLYYFDDDPAFNDWLLLIDFNYKEGDANIPTYDFGFPLDDTSILEEGVMILADIPRRYLKLERDQYWIEGIGSPRLFYINNYPKPTYKIDQHIATCTLDGDCIFNYDEFQNVCKIETIDYSETDGSRIYNLNGIVVDYPQPGSIYIRGGKKFVAK